LLGVVPQRDQPGRARPRAPARRRANGAEAGETVFTVVRYVGTVPNDRFEDDVDDLTTADPVGILDA